MPYFANTPNTREVSTVGFTIVIKMHDSCQDLLKNGVVKIWNWKYIQRNLVLYFASRKEKELSQT